MAVLALGLGSNLGNRLSNLREAVERLRPLGKILRRSDVFETEPWGLLEQPRFLNACLTLELESKPAPAPGELLRFVKDIEHEMGRRKTVRWGARNIDIDLLLLDGLVFQTPELQIPHARLPEREFVLLPLRQILPEWRHPVLGLSVQEMLAGAQSSGSPSNRPVRIVEL